jgi:putative permease
MFKQFYKWYEDHFSDPNLNVLFLILGVAFFTFYLLGHILMPLFTAIVFAYFLDWPVQYLTRFKLSRGMATFVVMALFITLMFFAALGILPTVFKQAAALLNDLPNMLNQVQSYLITLPDTYPEFLDITTVELLITNIRDYILNSGGFLLSYSFSSILNIAALMVYAILVPLLMLFMLKDKKLLMDGAAKFIPKNNKLVVQVWNEMDGQILNYIRGKLIEILIVGVATYAVFFIMDLQYSALLAVLVGFSVLIPYVGAVAVTVPVVIVALLQWGATADFIYLMVAYGVVQALDGNVVVPLLFSEAVSLHPVVIILSVLIFGGLWGFWGVFFAIPLASLVKAILNAWASKKQLEVDQC